MYFTQKKTQKVVVVVVVSRMWWRPKASVVTKRKAYNTVSTNQGSQNYETKYFINF